MAFTAAQIAAAVAVQNAAAHDPSTTVRLVAGPGTGKSSSIEERVCWLLSQNVSPARIHVVSFTRASTLDLRRRVHARAQEFGYEGAKDVHVTTLHSLALRLLRSAGQLEMYPVDPMVLDNWELENIFDEEFAHVYGVGKERRLEIRLDHEAFWSTGEWEPANYLPPDPPITADERTNFEAFHGPRTQTYACVLPGEIIRLCVTQMEAGLIHAIDLLDLQHLIVDEFQDLNPLDLRFVGHLIQQGATVFVAGDDDQSVYSFRFASPAGIQTFPATYPGTGTHNLNACFRCPPRILHASTTLIGAFPAPGRIEKEHFSLYAEAEPPVNGTVHHWRFAHPGNEATAIAQSCKRLVDAGMNPRDILILLSNQRVLGRPIIEALEESEVECEHPREEGFLHSESGRLTLALLRVVCDPDDYISLRAIMGLRNRVGVTRCNQVFQAVLGANLNFRSIFYDAIPEGVITGALRTVVNHARTTCAAMNGWQGVDTLVQRSAAISEIIENQLGAAAVPGWNEFIADLPGEMYLSELRDFLWADTDDQQRAVLEDAFIRLGMEIPEQGVVQPRVRIMTMHGAKGLSARVVFIPGLEEQIFPGPRRHPFPGLVLEAARLLYVSVTRARAACVMSYSTRRIVNGEMRNHTYSRFAAHLGGPFAYRNDGALTPAEVELIMADCVNL